jgi:hypothetical protein
MSTNHDRGKPMEKPRPPDPQLPDPPEPRKSMEIRASDANMPDPPPPMLSCEEVPDSDAL